MTFKGKAEEAGPLNICTTRPLLKRGGQCSRAADGKETTGDHLCSNKLSSSRKPEKQKTKKQHLFKTHWKMQHSLKGEQMEKTSTAS